MEDPKFHNVNPESLNEITIQDIQSGNLFPDETLNYSLPIPTHDQSIPHSSQDAWLTVEHGFDSTVLPNV